VLDSRPLLSKLGPNRFLISWPLSYSLGARTRSTRGARTALSASSPIASLLRPRSQSSRAVRGTRRRRIRRRQVCASNLARPRKAHRLVSGDQSAESRKRGTAARISFVSGAPGRGGRGGEGYSWPGSSREISAADTAAFCQFIRIYASCTRIRSFFTAPPALATDNSHERVVPATGRKGNGSSSKYER